MIIFDNFCEIIKVFQKLCVSLHREKYLNYDRKTTGD